MPLLTVDAQIQQPDYAALAIVAVLLLFLIAAVLRKRFGPKKSIADCEDKIADGSQSQDVPAAVGTAGQLKLHGVDPKTAAMLMALVADKTNRPLNELRFISIREVKGK